MSIENINVGKNIDLLTEENNKNIVLAGGCFWGTQEFLRRLPGVVRTFTAYANGNKLDPSYAEVCSGNTDHVEAVYVEYNPNIIDLNHLLYYFFKSFDPTQKDRQGNDIGRQYRNGIYYINEYDLEEIKKFLDYIKNNYNGELTTELLALENISKAEENHQNYLIKNPLGYCHVNFNNLPNSDANFKGELYD